MSQTGSHDQLQQPVMTKEMTIALFRLMLVGLGVESNRTRSHVAVQTGSASGQSFIMLCSPKTSPLTIRKNYCYPEHVVFTSCIAFDNILTFP